ncbi:MAG: MFS transporter [Elusimicrobia bacterium]|nr:MFS transporter [Elusimicrobiota bacterium]
MTRILRNRNFLLLWIGQTISSLGSWVNFVGLNLLVYQLAGSGKVLGAFLLVRMVPSVLFGALGGHLADRYPRKTVMMACDASRAVLVLGFLVTDSLAAYFLLGFLLSGIDKVFLAANGAFVPDIVGEDDLVEANSFQRMSHSIITVLGPAAGGMVVALYSYKLVFVIDALSFAASVACLRLILTRRHARAGKSEGLVKEFKAAFSFFAGHAALSFLGGVRLIDGIGSGAYNTALPIFSKSLQVTRGAAYGWLVASWGLGEFIGAVLATRLSKMGVVSRERLFCASVAVMAVGMGLAFWSGGLFDAMVAVLIGGVGDGVSTVLFNTALMKETPSHIRGKVYGCVASAAYTAVALGMGVSGVLIDKCALRSVTNFASIFIIAGMAAVYLLRSTPARRGPRAL